MRWWEEDSDADSSEEEEAGNDRTYQGLTVNRKAIIAYVKNGDSSEWKEVTEKEVLAAFKKKGQAWKGYADVYLFPCEEKDAGAASNSAAGGGAANPTTPGTTAAPQSTASARGAPAAKALPTTVVEFEILVPSYEDKKQEGVYRSGDGSGYPKLLQKGKVTLSKGASTGVRKLIAADLLAKYRASKDYAELANEGLLGTECKFVLVQSKAHGGNDGIVEIVTSGKLPPKVSGIYRFGLAVLTEKPDSENEQDSQDVAALLEGDVTIESKTFKRKRKNTSKKGKKGSKSKINRTAAGSLFYKADSKDTTERLLNYTLLLAEVIMEEGLGHVYKKEKRLEGAISQLIHTLMVEGAKAAEEEAAEEEKDDEDAESMTELEKLSAFLFYDSSPVVDEDASSDSEADAAQAPRPARNALWNAVTREEIGEACKDGLTAVEFGKIVFGNGAAEYKDLEACVRACFTAVSKTGDFKFMKAPEEGAAAGGGGGLSPAEKAAKITAAGLTISANAAAEGAKEVATHKAELDIAQKIASGASQLHVIDNRAASKEQDERLVGCMSSALVKAIATASGAETLRSVLQPHWNDGGIVDLSLEDGKFRLKYTLSGNTCTIKNVAMLRAFVQNLGAWDAIPDLTIVDHF